MKYDMILSEKAPITVENMPCGQLFSIRGWESLFVKVRNGEGGQDMVLGLPCPAPGRDPERCFGVLVHCRDMKDDVVDREFGPFNLAPRWED